MTVITLNAKICMSHLLLKDTFYRFSYLEGEISLEEAVDRIKKETRHFAKRQITWFKRESEVTWIEMEKYFKKEDMLKVLLQKCREKGVI